MCERKARREHRVLPEKFWQHQDWKKFFIYQAVLANRLLKKYEPAAVSRVIRSPRGRNTFSLAGKWLLPLIEAEQKQLDLGLVADRMATPEIPSGPVAKRPAFIPKQSTLNKLKGLD